MKRVILTLVLVGICSMSMAQFPPVTIPGSHVRKIHSDIVSQDYELHILLPGGYEKSTKQYPVVYLMDAQWDFPLVKSIYGQQYYDGFIPELIVVGVTWGGIKPNPDSLRLRDYTPTNDGRASQGGQADKFLDFMKKELFPFIESNYRAGSTDRILMGCSLGGLFTLYTLFTQPELFSGYVAASPAVGWNNEVLYKYEKRFAAMKLFRPVKVFFTVGDVERSRPVYQKFSQKLLKSNASATVHSRILENTGHSGTKSETYTRGLQFVFQKPKLDLPPAILNRYTGKYNAGPGNVAEIKNEKGRLVLYADDGERIELFAAGENEFYTTSQFLNIVFKLNGSKVEGAQVNMYGASRFVDKIE